MNEFVLSGCRPEPLAGYLKALGALRLVAEQRDGEARGFWRADEFILRTSLDSSSVVSFFMDGYVPTPLVAPWNGRSGFFREKKRPSERLLDELEASTNPRLAVYRETIQAARRVFDRAQEMAWDPKSDKALWIESCRAAFPDDAVPWVDAVGVLSGYEGSGEARRPSLAFPPVLGGSGGVLGSMDLTSNFAARIKDVLGFANDASDRDESSREWLTASLYGDSTCSLIEESASQFYPGAVGFDGSSSTGGEGSLINPWDFVLLLEGVLLLAAAPARRLSAGSIGRAAIPFTVAAAAPGLGSASETAGRSETWLPLWERPSMIGEVEHLFGEGRAEWRGRQVRDALDFARSVASLGVDRGISEFVRYAFVERMGQSNAAVPVARLRVESRAGVTATGSLDEFLGRLRSARHHAPASVQAALRAADDALYRVAQCHDPSAFQSLLVAVARLEMAVGRSSRFREDVGVRPVTGLRATDWIAHVADGTAELRVAIALASAHDDDGSRLRLLLQPVRENSPFGVATWADGPAPVPGIEHADLFTVLAQALIRRTIGVAAFKPPDGEQMVGVQPAYRWRVAAPLGAVAAFVRDDLDAERVRDLLLAAMLLDWRGKLDLGPSTLEAEVGEIDPAWALLAPFFHGRLLEHEVQRIELRAQSAWPRQLASSRVDRVIAAAERRLRMAHLEPAIVNPKVVASNTLPGTRLAAGLLCPLTDHGASALLRRATVPPDLLVEEGRK